jgi:hypothetical protein
MLKYRDPLIAIGKWGAVEKTPYISVVVKEASRWAQWHNRGARTQNKFLARTHARTTKFRLGYPSFFQQIFFNKNR